MARGKSRQKFCPYKVQQALTLISLLHTGERRSSNKWSMDGQRIHLFNWGCFNQEKSMDELRRSFFLTMELEEVRLKAEEDLKIKDEQIFQLKELLGRVIKERDEAQENCQNILLEKMLLQRQLQHSGISSIEDEPIRGIESQNGISSQDSDESIVSSPPAVPPLQPAPEAELPLVVDRPLPEKGKLLQAVMKAGPLLQTLLLAGPLPQWRHPPPPMDTYQIPPPPVIIPPQRALDPFLSNVEINRKRGLSEGSDSSIELKYQRVVFQ